MTVILLNGCRLLAYFCIPSLSQGTSLRLTGFAGSSVNSRMFPPTTVSLSSSANSFSCRSHRSKTEISSESIFAINSFLQWVRPIFNAAPVPIFCGRRTRWSMAGFCARCRSKTASSSAVSGPSHTITKSSVLTVWSSMLWMAVSRYTGSSFAYTDIKTEYSILIFSSWADINFENTQQL